LALVLCCNKRYVMKMKRAISFRLSPETILLLKRLAEEKGVSQAAILEMALREMAKREMIVPKS